MTSGHAHDSHGDSEWRVTRCACGRLTLRLGQVRIELSPDEFAQLHGLLRHAMTEFEIAVSDRPIHRVHAATH